MHPRRVAPLAICKPTIRRVAPEGNVIIEFAGDRVGSDGYEDNPIVYALVVSIRVASWLSESGVSFQGS